MVHATDLRRATDDETSQLLLSLMQQRKEIKSTIPVEDMMNHYKKWRETTTTSPSGRHLGHFHALFRAFSFENAKDKEKIEEMRQEIIILHHAMLMIAMKNSFVYERWKTINCNTNDRKKRKEIPNYIDYE